MSVYFITYNNGKKMMTPVIDAKAYLGMRQSEGQRRLTEAAHNGATYKNKNGEEVSVKTRLQQYNYSCLPNDDGTLARSQRLSRSVAMDIDYPGEGCGKALKEWKEEVRDMVMGKKDEVGALMFGDSATKGFHLVFRRHADRLRKAGCRPCPRNAVQCFIPPVVCGNSQPGNLRRIIAKLRHLLSRRHP